MNKLLVTIILVITGIAVFAQDATTIQESSTYLIYRQAFFPQDRFKVSITPLEYQYFIETGNTTIDDADGQPIAKTEYTVNYNGKYALWTVSLNDDDVNAIESMLDMSYIVKLSSTYVKVKNTENGPIQYSETETYSEIPSDFYEVNISTP